MPLDGSILGPFSVGPVAFLHFFWRGGNLLKIYLLFPVPPCISSTLSFRPRFCTHYIGTRLELAMAYFNACPGTNWMGCGGATAMPLPLLYLYLNTCPVIPIIFFIFTLPGQIRLGN